MAVDFHRRLKLVRQIPRPMPPQQRINVTIEDAGPGGLLEVEGNLHLIVGETHYQQGKTPYREFNLVDVETGKKHEATLNPEGVDDVASDQVAIRDFIVE